MKVKLSDLGKIIKNNEETINTTCRAKSQPRFQIKMQ